MTAPPIDEALPAGHHLLLDTTTLIAYLNQGEAVSPLASHIIDELVSRGRNQAVVSIITVMELLVRPLRQKAREPYQRIIDFLTNFPNLRIVNIDLDVAQEAASLRATHNFSPPDALIIATGIAAGVGHLVTNDDEWLRRLQSASYRVKVCHLADYLPFP